MGKDGGAVCKTFPMKDAPRDGTEILAWSSAGKNWHPVQWVVPHRDYAWRNPTCPQDYGYWGMRWCEEYNQADGQFDCWTHLPPDPRAARQDKDRDDG